MPRRVPDSSTVASCRRVCALLATAVAAGLVLFAAPAAATVRHGTVVVRISTPRAVAANVVLAGPRRRRVLAKPASTRRQRFELSVAVGHASVRAATVVAHGEVYAARVSRHRFRVRKGHKLTVRVRYRALPVATGLQATAISASSVTLAWTGSEQVKLRRALGAVAPRHLHGGVPVPTGAGQATDQGLHSGSEYSYSLFTRVRGHWAAPVTLEVGTSSGAAAGFSAPPTTTIVRGSQPFGVSVRHRAVSVTLPAAQPTPVLGAGFVLPISRRLGGGFVGRVASISPDGRTVTLAQAGLTDVFDSYHVDAAISATTHPSTSPRRHGLLAAQAASAGCDPDGSLDVDVDPSIHWTGHFSASIIDGAAAVPKGLRFSLQADPTVSLAETISVDRQFKCAIKPDRFVVPVVTDPVPISIVFEPEINASIGGKLTLSGLRQRATVNLTASAELGAHSHVSAGLTFKGDVQGANEAEVSAPIEGTLGGQLTFGPGAGSTEAGAVAGISGTLDPVKLSLEPAIDTKRRDLCLTTTLGGDASLGLNAEAWIGGLSAQASWHPLSKSWNYFAPIRQPAGCEDRRGRPHQPGSGNPPAPYVPAVPDSGGGDQWHAYGPIASGVAYSGLIRVADPGITGIATPDALHPALPRSKSFNRWYYFYAKPNTPVTLRIQNTSSKRDCRGGKPSKCFAYANLVGDFVSTGTDLSCEDDLAASGSEPFHYRYPSHIRCVTQDVIDSELLPFGTFWVDVYSDVTPRARYTVSVTGPGIVPTNPVPRYPGEPPPFP